MKTLFYFALFFSTAYLSSCSDNQPAATATTEENQQQTADSSSSNETGVKKPLSPRVNAMGNIGGTHIHIDYSSPGVRGRTIWGGLVAYDRVWVTGAHQATSINFDNKLKIANKTIPPGKYGFFTIPGKEEWTIILNEDYKQHLADNYDEKKDVVRFNVVPERREDLVESLTYEIISTGAKKGVISVSWEHIKITFPVEEM